MKVQKGQDSVFSNMTMPTIFKVGSVVPLFDRWMRRLFLPDRLKTFLLRCFTEQSVSVVSSRLLVLLTLKDFAVVVMLAVAAVVSIRCCCVMTVC